MADCDGVTNLAAASQSLDLASIDVHAGPRAQRECCIYSALTSQCSVVLAILDSQFGANTCFVASHRAGHHSRILHSRDFPAGLNV